MADLAVVSQTGHEAPVGWVSPALPPRTQAFYSPPASRMLTERGKKPRCGEASGRWRGEPGLHLCSPSFPLGSSSEKRDCANPASGGSLENMLKVLSSFSPFYRLRIVLLPLLSMFSNMGLCAQNSIHAGRELEQGKNDHC